MNTFSSMLLQALINSIFFIAVIYLMDKFNFLRINEEREIIKFDDFLILYENNSSKWTIYSNFVSYANSYSLDGRVYYTFSGRDKRKYQKWHKEYDAKRRKNATSKLNYELAKLKEEACIDQKIKDLNDKMIDKIQLSFTPDGFLNEKEVNNGSL